MSELTRSQLLMSVISGRGPAYLRGVDLSSIDLSNAGWLAEADLQQSNLFDANFSRANLKGANLSHSNLYAARLAGANLEGAALCMARLNGANLRLTNLKDANLSGASLVSANLVRANLEGANLEGADLEGANLEGANLMHAQLSRANLKMADLRGARLEAANLVGTLLDKSAKPVEVPVHKEGFSGSMQHVQLPDLIQLLCLSHADVRIQLKSGYDVGFISIRAGQVWHAQAGELVGERAFCELFQWKEGHFDTVALPEGEAQTINKAWEHLIIEAIRLRDERQIAAAQGQYGRLLQGIRKHLPSTAQASEQLIELLSRDGKRIKGAHELQIKDAFFSVETDGILCSIIAGEEIFIAPLDYLDLEEDHPLAKYLRAYKDVKELNE